MIVTLKNGFKFNYTVEGKSGAPWLMTSNAHGTNLSVWDDFTAALRERYQILRYDQRGHGGTPSVTPPYKMSELVEDVIGILDALKIERTHFVGVSMGGATALGLAMRHPDRLLSVVPCDTALGTSPDARRDWQRRIEIAQAEGLEALVEPTVTRWFAKSSIAADSPSIGRVRKMIRATSLDGYVGCANALQESDLGTDVEKITTPCLLVSGAEDGTRPVVMNELHKRIAGSDFRVIPSAGHLPCIENPSAFNAAVIAFIDGVAR